jgi:hypothetical protein
VQSSHAKHGAENLFFAVVFFGVMKRMNVKREAGALEAFLIYLLRN